jgi:hypothetical protein
MSTFNWLFLGHLLGDWVLQNDWMAKRKKKGPFTMAGLAHFTIYSVTLTGTLWLSDDVSRGWLFYLLFGFIVFISHWLIDATDIIERWMHFYRQSHLEVVRTAVDQTLHLLVLAGLIAIFTEA